MGHVGTFFGVRHRLDRRNLTLLLRDGLRDVFCRLETAE